MQANEEQRDQQMEELIGEMKESRGTYEDAMDHYMGMLPDLFKGNN